MTKQRRNDVYCPECGSCGEVGCCGVRCLYVKSQQGDYDELVKENAQLEEENEALIGYIDGLVTDCDNIRTFIWTHGVNDAFAPSRKIFNKLPPNLKERLINLQGDANTNDIG